MWRRSLAPLGREPGSTGGYRRFAWTRRTPCCASGSPARPRPGATWRSTADRAGNLWAWSGTRTLLRAAAWSLAATSTRCPTAARSTGRSASCRAFAALDVLRAQRVHAAGRSPSCDFADEEGARFGVACVGSRLLTGALDPTARRA